MSLAPPGEQTAYLDQTLSPIVIKVTQADGTPVAGVDVTLTPQPGAAVSNPLVRSDANGLAAFDSRLGLMAGSWTFTASAAVAGSPLNAIMHAVEPPGGTVFNICNAERQVVTGVGIGGAASVARVDTAGAIQATAAGGYYVAMDCRVLEISPEGVLQVIAGTGVCGFNGDLAQDALSAQLNNIHSLALDEPAGRLYVGDSLNKRVRVVDLATGLLSTYAGGGSAGPPDYGDNGLATDASLLGGNTLSVDSGALYVSDRDRVRRVDPITHNITTFLAGDGTCSTRTTFNGCGGGDSCYMAWDSTGRLYISGLLCGSDVASGFQTAWGIVRRELDGSLTHIAGRLSGLNDGTALQQTFSHPPFLALDEGVGLYNAQFQDPNLKLINLMDGTIANVSGAFVGPVHFYVPESEWQPYSATGLTAGPAGHVVLVENNNYITLIW